MNLIFDYSKRWTVYSKKCTFVVIRCVSVKQNLVVSFLSLLLSLNVCVCMTEIPAYSRTKKRIIILLFHRTTAKNT